MTVTLVSSQSQPIDMEREMALRRLAVQLASQLPESIEDALGVLSLTETLVRSFLARCGPTGGP
jgi:hypothetical protein